MRIKEHIPFIVLLSIYIFAMLSIISWGIPGLTHPFTYHMDEWHQLGSVLSLYRNFSSNTDGAAGGTIFHFILSLGYVGVLYLFHIINPRLITSSITQLSIQHELFFFLRIETLLFAVGIMCILYSIAKRLFPTYAYGAVLLMVLTPVWITLTNYFKYDIALLFWQVLACNFYLLYIHKSTSRNFYLAAIFSALALSTKVAALPLFVMLFITYFFFTKQKQKNMTLVKGILLYLLIVLLLGMPDILLNLQSRQSFFYFLYANLVIPQVGFDYLLPSNWLSYLLFNQYPMTFGYGLALLSAISFLYWIYQFVKAGWKKTKTLYKTELFLMILFFLYEISLLSLKMEGRSNRLLVLLPFFVILSFSALQHIIKTSPESQKIIKGIIVIIICSQVYQTLGWWSVKMYPDPRQTASAWIEKNIPEGSTIAIENIPIYQMIPDINLHETAFLLAKKPFSNKYEYQIIMLNDTITAEYIILTNIDSVYEKSSEKPALVQKITSLGYRKIISFAPQSFGYNVFADKKSFAISMLIPIPTITIYQKQTLALQDAIISYP